MTSETPSVETPTKEARPRSRLARVAGGLILLVALGVGAFLWKLDRERAQARAQEDARIRAEQAADAHAEQTQLELAELHKLSHDDASFCAEARARYAAAQKRREALPEPVPEGYSAKELGWGAFAKSAQTLCRVAQSGDAALTRILLDLGADPRAASSERLPLALAARGDHVEVVKLLLAAGAEAQPALVDAARGRSLNSLRLLLEAGADPKGSPREDESFTPPLCAAVSTGALEVARALLEAGADPNWGGSWLRNSRPAPAPPPLQLAVTAGATSRTRLGLVELLLAKGAAPDRSLAGSPTPVVRAMRQALSRRDPESIAIVAALFKAGATLDPGPDPFSEGDKSFEGDPPPKTPNYHRKPPLLAGLSEGHLGKRVDRGRLYEVVAALVELAKASRPDEVAAQTKATVNRIAQGTSSRERFLAPGVVGALRPAALDLRHATPLDAKQLARFVKRHPDFQTLHLGFNPKLKAGDLSALLPLEELRHLSLGKEFATPEGLGLIAQLPGLRSLALRGSPSGEALAKLTRLESLDLHNASGTLPDLAFLEQLSALVHLDLFKPRFDPSELRRLASLPKLRALSLPASLQDADLEVLLQAAPAVEELRFRGGSRLSDAGLERLAGFERLRLLAHPSKRHGEGLTRLRAAAPKLQIVEPKDYVSGLELLLRETR